MIISQLPHYSNLQLLMPLSLIISIVVGIFIIVVIIVVLIHECYYSNITSIQCAFDMEKQRHEITINRGCEAIIKSPEAFWLNSCHPASAVFVPAWEHRWIGRVYLRWILPEFIDATSRDKRKGISFSLSQPK